MKKLQDTQNRDSSFISKSLPLQDSNDCSGEQTTVTYYQVYLEWMTEMKLQWFGEYKTLSRVVCYQQCVHMTPEEEIRGNGTGSKVLDLSSHTKHLQDLHLSTRVSDVSKQEGLHPVTKQQWKQSCILQLLALHTYTACPNCGLNAQCPLRKTKSQRLVTRRTFQFLRSTASPSTCSWSVGILMTHNTSGVYQLSVWPHNALWCWTVSCVNSLFNTRCTRTLCLRDHEICLLLDHRPVFVNELLPTTRKNFFLMLCFAFSQSRLSLVCPKYIFLFGKIIMGHGIRGH
jgi:hypothetical protein